MLTLLDGCIIEKNMLSTEAIKKPKKLLTFLLKPKRKLWLVPKAEVHSQPRQTFKMELLRRFGKVTKSLG